MSLGNWEGEKTTTRSHHTIDCMSWGLVCLPFLIAGGISIQKLLKEKRKALILLAMSAPSSLSFGGSDDAGSVVVEEVHSDFEPIAAPLIETLIGGELPPLSF